MFDKNIDWKVTSLAIHTSSASYLPPLPPSLFNKSQWWHRNHTRNTLWPIADCYSVSLHSRKHRTSIISFMICSLWTQLYQLSATLRSSAYIRHLFPSLHSLSLLDTISVFCVDFRLTSFNIIYFSLNIIIVIVTFNRRARFDCMGNVYHRSLPPE